MKSPAIVPSASIILLDPNRSKEEPFSIFLLKRRSQSRFMPNRFVFPGGRVEKSDGPDPFSDEALRLCALRELWEESGVIICREAEKAAALSPQVRGQAQNALQKGECGVREAAERLGLAMDRDALIPYARWITPSARAQRFDATFYLAVKPAGQQAASDRKETSQGLWLGPERALAENRQGRVELAPPQVRMLGELAGYQSLEELLRGAGEFSLEPVRPFLWAENGGRVVLLPWDPDHEAKRPVHQAQPCPAGVASRLVHENGLWLPFRCQAR